MDRINVIVKTTNNCNLRCKYCYNGDAHFTKETLDLASVKRLFTVLAADFREISVVWHGGEPLSCGIDYFREVMAIEQGLAQYKGNTVTFTNSVQTNGTLIDDEWIAFFKKHKFKVGISFDGIHNEKYRQMTDRVLESIEKMKKKGMGVSCLAVVADDQYDLVENYEFFARRGINVEFSYLFMEGCAKDLAPLSPQGFTEKYKALVDHWFTHRNGVGVRLIETYVAMALGNYFRICNNSSCHGKYLAIWPNGDIFNCARDSMSAYPFGNVNQIECFDDLLKSDGFTRLIQGSIERRARCKETCQYFGECAGGCADCAIAEGSLSTPPAFSCYCFQTIYPYVKQKVEEIKAKGTPLDQLNPGVKNTFVRCMSVSDGPNEKEIAQKFV